MAYNVGNISKIRINIDSNGNILAELLNPGNKVVIDNTITLPSNASTFTVTGRPDIKTTGTNVYKIGLILSERNQAQIDNAMIGYDGKNYSTLGSSVRGQTGQNFGYLEFDRINLNGTKYFTNIGTIMMYSSKETGFYRVGEDTIVSAATTYKTFEIDVTTCEEYIIIGTSSGSSANIYDVYRGYDSEGNVIEHVPNTAGDSIAFTYNIKIPNYVTKIMVTFSLASTFKIIKKRIKGRLKDSWENYSVVWYIYSRRSV